MSARKYNGDADRKRLTVLGPTSLDTNTQAGGPETWERQWILSLRASLVDRENINEMTASTSGSLVAHFEYNIRAVPH